MFDNAGENTDRAKIDRSKIKLRKASSSDIEELIDFRIIFLSESYENPGEEIVSHLRETLRSYFTKSFGNETFISWIVEYEGNPVGFSGLVIREQPGNFDIPDGRTGYILNMFTLKPFRGAGIGSMLFEKLITEGKQLGLNRLDLHATRKGEPIYRRFGFSEPHDLVMEKLIR
jgi:GNAT superfamily N-acetyltransferase